jgi:hypothetical protein
VVHCATSALREGLKTPWAILSFEGAQNVRLGALSAQVRWALQSSSE